MDDEFYRIQRLPPYVFAEVNAMKAKARARGEDIVDLGMGNPDGSPPRHVIDKLAEVAGKPHVHRYSASRGIPGLRKAQAAYYERRFGVKLDPDKEVIVCLGSKEGLANLAQAITAPGDVVLAPNPSYPIHSFGFIIAGAAIRSIPAAPGEDFFIRLENAMRFTVPRPRVLVIGYPSNPTAYVADLDFYKRLVKFARENELIVISDLAYAEIYFGDTPTPSILQVKGANDACGREMKRLLDVNRRGAMSWSRASAAPAGKFPCRKRRCSPGRRSPSAFTIWDRWSSRRSC
jgi:alanine-synthesizing transaminase